jgi:hypothetical protein
MAMQAVDDESDRNKWDKRRLGLLYGEKRWNGAIFGFITRL